MPHFFFHLRGHSEEILDPDGSELPDLATAREKALVAARDTLCHDVRDGSIDLRLRVDVEDAGGNLLYSLPFKGAFTLIE